MQNLLDALQVQSLWEAKVKYYKENCDDPHLSASERNGTFFGMTEWDENKFTWNQTPNGKQKQMNEMQWF